MMAKGVPNSAIDKSAREAFQPITDEAVSLAKGHRQPRRPKGGHIDENIKFLRRKDSTRRVRNFVLGAVGKRKSILTWLEFGVAPHVQPIRLRGGIHPGHRPFPIMRPAYDAHSQEVTERFGREIWKYVAAMALTINKGRK
jgi:hypothetical protein